MPVVGTKAAASSQGFGEFAQASSAPVYIEQIFSTYLYTGNGSTQTITNGIDLATYGGLVWGKARNFADDHVLIDTARGASNYLSSNNTLGQQGSVNGLTAFNSNGFSVGSANILNSSTRNYASWTFRKQPKFFDVVTYTGNGVAGRTVAHNLGSTPGCIIVKATSAANDWLVYHTSLGNTQGMSISSTSAAATSTTYWNNTSPTSTQFTVGTSPRSNENGTTFVAYLFAHNAGGFGLTGTDNVISCGSYTGNGGTTTPNQISIGFEPQWLLIKASSTTSNWAMGDLMRGMYTESGGTAKYKELLANTSGAEGGSDGPAPTATGFAVSGTGLPNASGVTYIYIAIRRGPMKTPTSGTSVFTPYQVPASPTTGAITGFVTDAGFIGSRAGADKFYWGARLMGNPTLNSTNTNAQSANTNQIWDRMNGWWNTAINNYMTWGFARAPGFMDVVCWSGNDAAPRNINHNLTVVPEMMIVKRRSGVGNWVVYHKNLPSALYYLSLNATDAQSTGTNVWRSTAPTATVFTVGSDSWVNTSSDTYVNYLFASCPGVSKVGSYSGTGGTQTISCGFAARFVLIKRTDSTGDWWVWDTARGMVAGTDPRLALNSTAAETNANWVYTDASGFQIVSTDATVNASGGTYIFLAIA